jgi:hypothetical protein
MRIYPSPVCHEMKQPHPAVGTGMPNMERFRMCEVPKRCALLPQDGLADAITPNQVFTVVNAAEFLRSMMARREL